MKYRFENENGMVRLYATEDFEAGIGGMVDGQDSPFWCEIEAGQKGGLLESANLIDPNGSAWVHDGSKVTGDTYLTGNVIVGGGSVIHDAGCLGGGHFWNARIKQVADFLVVNVNNFIGVGPGVLSIYKNNTDYGVSHADWQLCHGCWGSWEEFREVCEASDSTMADDPDYSVMPKYNALDAMVKAFIG